MPMKKYKPEQMVALLHQVEAEIASGKKLRTPARKPRSPHGPTIASGENSAV
jgi:hypothetical protein